ncbi:MAG: SDR family NAD(P)-dependent oxidoreductase [Acidiferrobacterales bacterium]
MLDSHKPLHAYKASLKLLDGRVILVTGADTDLGETVAEALAAHHATVVLLGNRRKRLEETYDRIEAGGAPQPALMPINLIKASADAYEQLADTLGSEFGLLDGIAHCGMEVSLLSPLELFDLPIFAEVMQANVTAPYLLTRTCLGLLKESHDASIVFTSSEVGREGKPYWGAYGIACFAIEGMMQIWAAELAGETGIRVNSLATGPIRTTSRAKIYPGEDPTKLLTPEEIVAAYLYLLGPESKDITGRALHAQQPLA